MAENLPGPAPNTAGPHRSDAMNKLDPTVDSQSGGTQVLGPGINATSAQGRGSGYDHAAPGSHHTHGATGATAAHSHTGQNHAFTGSTAASGTHPTQIPAGNQPGPVHNSRLANELDPRVNTSNANGGAPTAPMATAHNGGQPHHAGQPHLAGQPHHAGQPQYAGQPMGQPMAPQLGTATNIPEGTYGQHSSRIGNAIDPRVDSDRDRHANAGVHGHNTTTVHQGPAVQPGPATRTAGPHKSNIMNKLDPTVDSKATVTQQREYRTS